ncbi:hypothetical protein CSC3H3_09840 [Thalassospira marina]|uniref:YjiS-like domain-containing protein n=2 Tax=Thalassospira marina TaxID=2048283 RepID=A0ABN5FGH7_9PROT|nr:hypothetical protein CSC3H3_09840 [Thalassospira marina]
MGNFISHAHDACRQKRHFWKINGYFGEILGICLISALYPALICKKRNGEKKRSGLSSSSTDNGNHYRHENRISKSCRPGCKEQTDTSNHSVCHWASNGSLAGSLNVVSDAVGRFDIGDKMILTKIFAYLRALRIQYQTQNALAKLDQRELADIGLNRDQIEDVAHRVAFGH